MVGRTVQRPPYRGVKGLLTWAVDVWPFVNGQAVLHSVNLLELQASDMLDVIHYFFEQDMLVASSEEAEARSKMRTILYQALYEKTYNYQYTSSKNSYNYSTASGNLGMPEGGFTVDNSDSFEPDAPDKGPTKPFVPATDFNSESVDPFNGVLDPPAGH